MPLLPVEIPRFRGLDVTSDPQEAGVAAIDMLNVDLDTRGRLRSRDGYSKWTSSAATSRLGRLFGTVGTITRLFALRASALTVVAYKYDGTSSTSAALSAYVANVVHFGGSGGEAVYGGSGNGLNDLLKWTEGGGFTYPTNGGFGHYRYVGIQPWDNRLMLLHDNSNRSRVRWSDPGLPETYSTNNFLDLTPNDGSYIHGVATFDNQVFVFKRNRIFRFYGTSTDSTGQPIFNYTTIDTGIGIPQHWEGACCTSPNGVYFLGADGVYVTRGGPPVKVSRALDPLFRGLTPATYLGSAINQTDTAYVTSELAGPSLCWHNDRLHLTIPTGTSTTNDRMFVLDAEAGWVAWSIPAGGLASWIPSPSATDYLFGDFRNLFFSYATGTNDIGVIQSSATTDAGTAISSRYRTGFMDLGLAGAEKAVRELLFDGYGTVTSKVAVNDGSLGTGASVALGTSPAVAQGRDRRACRGRNFSLEVSATSGAWSVSRCVAHIGAQRPSGPKAT